MEKESVWLSQMQMADLFQKDRTVIGRHIKNIYKEGELAKDITCANFAHVGADADQTYNTTLYNLDVIISVGYRVKSIADTRFRQWANHVLKDYMLKDYAVNQRKIATGTRFDGLALITDLVKSAKRSVAFIDPFATIEVLKFAAMRAKGVQAVVYSARITPEFRVAADLHKKQYPGLDLKTMRTIHDRFLLVDDKVYHFGASFIKYEGREQRQCLH
ncbi:RhuM family protein [Fibrobacter sp.]|uniref:RhuM family protein n=1 Tax=Fibrobacter sp. TaxID=35828 RepID=UPI002630AD43|nr:RhuM family protein [Fibrobacter sp.]MDD5942889.1 RhuM family protein [Fibrobacter sp.]